MGLDIHVMRPRKFFLRDFVLPVQRHLPDIPVQTIGATPMTAFEADVAEKQVIKAVRLKQLDQVQNRYVLPEDDAIHFSEQFSYDRFNLLREFAAFLDYPQKRYFLWGDRAFGEGYDVAALPSLKAAWQRRRAHCPHLVFHEDMRGFYFPTRLTFPVESHFGFLGSTFSLREELEQVTMRAHLARDYREAVTEAAALLMQAVEASEQSLLPIVLDG